MHSWGDVPLAIPEHLVTTSLADDVADVVVDVGHRLGTRTRVTPRDLVDEEWVATPEGTICREWLTRMYDGTGRVPRMGREELGPDLVAVAAHDPEPTRSIMAVHRLSMAESPAVQAVVATLAATRPGGPLR